MIDGPFRIGDRVLIYDDCGMFVIGTGVVDVEHAPIDGEYHYGVRCDDGRPVTLSELQIEIES